MGLKNHEIESLLQSFETAQLMIEKKEGEKRHALVAEVLQLYEGHGKATQFLDWAVWEEIHSTKEAVSLCRTDSFLTHLLYVIFFSPVGIKFLVKATMPFLKEIEKHSKPEKRSSKDVHPQDGVFPSCEEDMEWAMKAIENLLSTLLASVNDCPLSIRGIFNAIDKAAAQHYHGGYHIRFVTTIIFLRFISPPLLNPHLFGLTDQDSPLRNECQRSLVWCLKLLQSIANNSNFDFTREQPKKLTDFIASKHIDASNFALSLLDEKEILKHHQMSAQTDSSKHLTMYTGKKGMLKKKGFWSNWKDSWFVSESGLLMEFKSNKYVKPVKVVNLKECVIKVAESFTGIPHSFAIFRRKRDPIFLLASSDVEYVEWISHFEKHGVESEVSWAKDEFLEAFNEAVIVASSNGTIMNVNEAAVAMLRYSSPNDLIGKPLTMLMPQEYGANHDKYMKRYEETGVKRLIGKPRQLPIVMADGSHAEIILSLGELEQGNVKKVMATMRPAARSTKDNDHNSVRTQFKGTLDNLICGAKKQMETKLEEELADTYAKLADSKQKNLVLSMKLKKQKDCSTKKHGCDVDIDHISISCKIMSVNGSDVFACIVDGWQCAMKELPLSGVEDLETRIFTLESLPVQKNLVRYLFHKKSNEEKLQVFMTMYACNWTSILDKRRAESNSFSVDDIIRFSLDISSGLCVLHNNGIVHTDVKSDNIFVMMNPMGIECLAVGNLDHASIMAHENLDSRVDVRSMGAVMYEMMTLRKLEAQESKNLEHPKDLAAKYEPLVALWKKCMSTDASQCPTSMQLKESLMKMREKSK